MGPDGNIEWVPKQKKKVGTHPGAYAEDEYETSRSVVVSKN